ncbi:nucleotide-binding frt1 [Ceratobasidium sp. AG-Ba]|nr:nucleotide-binding frt1 [Ceratobasidium sp. AG-Ba]
MSKFYPPEEYAALSCLSVGAGSGGSVSMLARATVIDYWGNVIFDSFVEPTEKVTNYKTTSTGIEEHHLHGSESKPFKVVQAEVADIIKDRIIIGYSLWTDLAVLGIRHIAKNTRDIALFVPFREALNQHNGQVRITKPIHAKDMPLIMYATLDSGASNTCYRPVVIANIQPLIYIDPVQAENARASLDIFRSVEGTWETLIFNDEWPCALPPPGFAQYFI